MLNAQIKVDRRMVTKALEELRATTEDFDMEGAIRGAGKAVAIQMTKAVRPFGKKGTDLKAQSQAAIRRDLQKVYASPSSVWLRIMQHTGDKDKADTVYYLLKNRRRAGAQKALAKYDIPGLNNLPISTRPTDSLHKNRRVNGTVKGGYKNPSEIVINYKGVERYANKIDKMIGVGKAGWVVAARAATNGKPLQANDRRVIDDFVRRAYKHAKGSATFIKRNGVMGITISNDVDYSARITDHKYVKVAVGKGYENILKSIKVKMEHIKKRGRRK